MSRIAFSLSDQAPHRRLTFRLIPLTMTPIANEPWGETQ